MEGQQQSNINELDGGSNNSSKGGAGTGSFLCRQSSTRWTPTSEQIRILKDLYYNNGIRSPSADQIQRISARLRQYGKIEGKNVFYWFQNHKARERQKKRFTAVTAAPPPPQSDHLHHHLNIIQRHQHHNNNNSNNNTLNPAHWRSSDQAHLPSINLYNNSYPPPPPHGVVPCPFSSSSGVFTAAGQMGSHGYGSVAMEKSFRDCSISPKDHNSTGGSVGQNISVPCAYPFLGKINSVGEHETLEEEDEDEDDDQACREIETLPLFPMHGEEYSSGFSCNNNNNSKPESSSGHYYTSGWYQSDINGSARASLELSLNSYITGSRSTDKFY